MRLSEVESPGNDTGDLSIINTITFLIVERQKCVGPVCTTHVDLKCSCRSNERRNGGNVIVTRTKGDHRVPMTEESGQHIVYRVLRVAEFF